MEGVTTDRVFSRGLNSDFPGLKKTPFLYGKLFVMLSRETLYS